VQLPVFQLERYFDKHEFTAQYLLSASDCETWSLKELLAGATRESLELWNGLRLGYTETSGSPLLREEVSKLYHCMQPRDILVAVPQEAIFLLMHTLLGEGDHAVVVTPAYQSLYAVAESTGCEITRLMLRPGGERWRLDLEELKGSLNDRSRLIVVNFPHNPTGYMPSREEFEALTALARERGLYLFCDEMYRLLEHDPERRLPSICDVYEKGITLSGLSKSFGLPGLRIGWLAPRDRTLLARCQGFKDYTTICASGPSEVLGILGLRGRDAILKRNREILARNLSAARAFCTSYPDLFRWLEPEGGPVAFPVWTGPGPVEEFCGAVLDETGVMIAYGELFEYPGGHFRIGMGRRNFPEALAQLEEFVKARYGPQ